jgi:hypothetical protein
MATAAILKYVNIACNTSSYPHHSCEVSLWSVQPSLRNSADKMCGRRTRMQLQAMADVALWWPWQPRATFQKHIVIVFIILVKFCRKMFNHLWERSWPTTCRFWPTKIVKNKELYRRNLSHPFSSLPWGQQYCPILSSYRMSNLAT